MTAPKTSVKMTQRQAAALYKRAAAAGLAAGKAAAPTPMVVVQRANPFDDNSRIVRQYAPTMGGVCGFANIKIRPAVGPFVRYLKGKGIGSPAYQGGYAIYVHEFGQSLERKSAYAAAFAAVLTEAGLNAYSESRMD